MTSRDKASAPTAKQARAACSRVWSQIVRLDKTCQAQGLLSRDCYGPLQGAHILPRSRATRVAFDPDNGLCLCSRHHILIDRNPGHWFKLMTLLDKGEWIEELQKTHDRLIVEDTRTSLMRYRSSICDLHQHWKDFPVWNGVPKKTMAWLETQG